MNYKLSKYTEFSDPIGTKQHRMVLSLRTNKAFLLNPQLIHQIQESSVNELSNPDLQALVDAEVLVPNSEKEIETIRQRFSASTPDEDLLYMVIHPVAGCQLNCWYCGQQHLQDKMTADDTARILNRIETKIQNGNFKKLHIAWFGGEPMLGFNYIKQITPQLKALAHQFGLSYAAKMVTNGQLLTLPKFEELIELSVREFEITLDGPKDIHDGRRMMKSGHGSFDQIVENIQHITEKYGTEIEAQSIRLNVRVNVDETNYSRVFELFDHLKDRNILTRLSAFYFAPVYSWGNEAHEKSLSLNDFAKLQTELLIRQIKLGMKPGLLPGTSFQWGCVIHSKSSEVIDATGDIACCTEVAYVDGYKDSEYYLANLKAPSFSKTRPSTLSFLDRITSPLSECSECKMLPICGGGCVKQQNENRLKCIAMKYNLKDRLFLSFYTNREQYIKA